jgi:hypothetical protein
MIDNLAETIEALQETERKKSIIFTNIHNNLANLQALEDYEKLKSYMKMVQRAVTVVESVIASQKIRFRKNEKVLAKLAAQNSDLYHIRDLSNAYERGEKKFLNNILEQILAAVRSFIKSSDDLVSEKRLV